MRLRSLCLVLMMVGCVSGPGDGGTRGDPSTGGKADGTGSATLLDCNTSLGPDQQVTVMDDGSQLHLVELTTSGAQVERDLSDSEWASQTLRLRADWGSTSTLSKEDGDWVVRSDSGDFGIADCWVDKSDE